MTGAGTGGTGGGNCVACGGADGDWAAKKKAKTRFSMTPIINATAPPTRVLSCRAATGRADRLERRTST
ncbi:hypothetical protein SPYCA_0877 [Sphingopyxis sp. FD7]|nr:hypothetical protein SPYCA_0877 [Sphingopyxis sp. FD7]